MSLSRSPSPRRGGGWASPGLTTPYDSINGRASPRSGFNEFAFNAGPSNSNVTWASAKAKSEEINGYPSFSTQNNGFFSRHARQLSRKLPSFNLGGKKDYAEKEKLGRGRWAPGRGSKIAPYLGRTVWRMRLRLLMILALILAFVLFYVTRKLELSHFAYSLLTETTALHQMYRRSPILGGGSNFVIILAANQGGGVMEWKGPREWAIERDSVKNKKKYVKKWGYDLEIVDMSTKKRYAHEWRESWEKVDTIRNCLRKYPKAQWYFLP